MNAYEIILIIAMVLAIVVLWLANGKRASSPEKSRFSSIIANGMAGGTIGAAIMYGIENHNYWIPLAVFVVFVLNNILIQKYQQSKSKNNQLNQ